MVAVHIGTCSWKYPSWRGLIYSDTAKPDYLREYAQKYDCVEVDQWFWSLYGPDKVVLPQSTAVAEYAAAVPEGFRFGIKMPNALTMTHFRPETKSDPLVPNPHFLSPEVLRAFLDRLRPLQSRLGPMMFQFEYLNRKKMTTQAEFLDKLGAFMGELPAGYAWFIESRNPNWLNAEYFGFLRQHGLGHVFLQGYYMPPVFGIYEQFADQLTDKVVIRLHGPDREGMEARTGEDWSQVVEPREDDLNALVKMVRDLDLRRRDAWLFINNHFEGCAPQTITRFLQKLGRG